jgi:hypothetical protein
MRQILREGSIAVLQLGENDVRPGGGQMERLFSRDRESSE